jgi:hypothetical protein
MIATAPTVYTIALCSDVHVDIRSQSEVCDDDAKAVLLAVVVESPDIARGSDVKRNWCGRRQNDTQIITKMRGITKECRGKKVREMIFFFGRQQPSFQEVVREFLSEA